ncbi:hypothetical protein M3P05_12660 [Sansalvadorimonas sp. 2012CJ34-2]|uniref:ParB/Sulfiredoxin domain-containing protein n=1 Tax=Parendozoicomonas callyspongiae TaxID=2942213 RepID=A0ABT0PID8_9GAMM|nr:hypothetical protein [Sansalvadorimonas sp. 2012CJ34-2]MCL6270776.1 hypothetical protein [Sansalvadorimonas sp. 2012CJ34-2]
MILKSAVKGGRWPVPVKKKFPRLVRGAVGSCPGLGPAMAEYQFWQWKLSRKETISAALVLQALEDSLTCHISPQDLQMRLAAVQFGDDDRVEYDLRDQFICSGNMSDKLSPISESRLNREIDELFACEMDWRKTQSYQNLQKRLQDSGAFRHNNVSIAEPAHIDQYFERYVRLTDSIERHGYQSRRDLRTQHRKSVSRRWRLEQGEEEVGVAIGPRGEIWRYRGGYHRTAIARNLGLASMPVMIKLVHEECLRSCLAGNLEMGIEDACSLLASRVEAD